MSNRRTPWNLAGLLTLSLASGTGCAPGRTVLVADDSPLRIGPGMTGQVYRLVGEPPTWVLGDDTVTLPEGWYCVPPRFVRPEDFGTGGSGPALVVPHGSRLRSSGDRSSGLIVRHCLPGVGLASSATRKYPSDAPGLFIRSLPSGPGRSGPLSNCSTMRVRPPSGAQPREHCVTNTTTNEGESTRTTTSSHLCFRGTMPRLYGEQR